MGTEVVASSSSVLTLDIVLYTQGGRLTNHPGEGVRHNITLILARNRRRNEWSVDCIDLGKLEGAFPQEERQAVLEGVFHALKEQGIEPQDVQGWFRFLHGRTVTAALNAFEQDKSED